MRLLRDRLLRSAGVRHSAVLGAGMITAGGLDYVSNLVVGRGLAPAEFGVFISAAAVLQVLTLVAMAIRMVVAFYVSKSVGKEEPRAVAAFLRHVLRWGWKYGALATVVMLLASPLLAHWLRLPNAWPLWAASGMVLMLFLREIAFGGLQGLQEFGGFSLVQVIQAMLRVALCAGLISLGLGAPGAILAQPLAAAACIALALAWLRPHMPRDSGAAHDVSWRYIFSTMLGLVVFGLLTNSDALFVRRYFEPNIAGNYGPVVTLAKICLFLPFAIGLVLFPKAARRKAAGIDTHTILLAALAAALSPGLALSAIYFLAPGLVVKTMFTTAYESPGIVLGLAGLAATLYAGLHIWLNYALSIGRNVYVYVLAAALAGQLLGMWFYGRGDLVNMTIVMVSAGLVGNVSGYATTWFPARSSETTPAGAVHS